MSSAFPPVVFPVPPNDTAPSSSSPPLPVISPSGETNATLSPPSPSVFDNGTNSEPPATANGSSYTPATNVSGGRGGLASGAMAGLIVGVILGATIVLVAVGIFVFFYKRKKRKDVEACNGGPSSDSVGPKGNPQQWHQGISEIGTFPKPSPPPGFGEGFKVPQMYPSMDPPPSSSSLGSDRPPGESQSPAMNMGLSQSMFTYEELSRATSNFSNMNLIGQGGFGYVHKGTLQDGRIVAIKQLKAGSGQGEREFQAEIQIISRVHHRHLVSLFGYCMTGSQRLLVYEFVPNKTLEYHLHEKGRPVMEWPTRMKIGLGAAKGLAYLHEDCNPRIIHRDIKAANILLDESFEAKLADFGLAKSSLDTDTHVSTRIMGTFGYLAPEYAASGKLTGKSDVFSFGVVLLELITGRRPVDKAQPFADDSIVDWAKPLMMQVLSDGNFDVLVDPKLERNYDTSEMTRMVACAAASVRHSAKRRPKMSQIVRALEGNMSIDDLTEGSAPGHSTIYSMDGSEDYSSAQYKEDLQKFKKMALESQTFGSSEFSGVTSDNGQNPSASSTEGPRNTRELEPERSEKKKSSS
ncbi:PREDICTED: proline-rich receptor-like protein kinase PERK15 [Tarenaya hassleriana]|uniref:proline-rich receptor-like protein kinase PERK15 n=1 Tax=Tarenaya hassleriana TaxID=28532 RepID=UPI00053C31B6|nr:PREDICTED: proline-rich receptor-like protein kinase PERK15 [Tarenaya hassleriana]